MSNLVHAPQSAAIEAVIATNDLSKLTPDQRVAYYMATCQSLGLNPNTQPFGYISFQGRIALYAKRDATDQLRKLHGVSVEVVSQEFVDDLFIVTVRATDKTGRTDTDYGVVTIGGLKGEARANAIMKAITKAKRRVTLSICGLGFLDESEVASVPDANIVDFDDAPQPVAKAIPDPKVRRARMEDKIAKLRLALISEGLQDAEDVNVSDLTDDQLIIVGKKLGEAWQKLGLGSVEEYLASEEYQPPLNSQEK